MLTCVERTKSSFKAISDFMDLMMHASSLLVAHLLHKSYYPVGKCAVNVNGSTIYHEKAEIENIHKESSIHSNLKV